MSGSTTTAAAMDPDLLFDDEDGAIVKLVAGRTRLVAHRKVLEAGSSGFRHLLQGGAAELTILDVEGLVLHQLLVFLYTGSVPAPQLTSMAPELLDAAKKYGVPGLEALCRSVGEDSRHVEPPAVGSRSSTATQAEPQGDHSQPAASAAPPTAASLTPPPVEAAASRYRGLPAETKARRLIAAAKQGAVGEIAALLAAGADVNATDRDSWTALHWAAREGHEDVAMRLLLSGAEVDARDKWQQTPLIVAAFWGRVAVARLLLVAGADANAREKAQGRFTPLHAAAFEGDAAVVRLLAAAGADLNARRAEGSTPLHCAAHQGHEKAAAALLEAGADRGIRNDDGDTPLTVATKRNHTALVDLLTRS